jgi:hypothetical protein
VIWERKSLVVAKEEEVEAMGCVGDVAGVGGGE